MLAETMSALKFSGELLGLVNRLPSSRWTSFLQRRSAPSTSFPHVANPEAVMITADRAVISLETQATGELWLYMVVSNFGQRPITNESLTVDYWLLQGQSMPEPTVIFKSAGQKVEKQAKVLAKIRLFEKEVALAMNTVPNDWSIPETLVREGLFDIVLRARQEGDARQSELRQRLENIPIMVSGAASVCKLSKS